MKFFKGKAAALFTAAAIGLTSMPVTAFAETAFMQDSVTVEYKATVAKPTYKIKGTPGKRKIKLSCATEGATIYYTTDGSVPTAKDTQYTGLIVITEKTKIRAVAIKNGTSSNVMTKTVKINTLIGDATGNGIVDETDYTRFKNYRAGKTSYICKDNCDLDGNGKLNAADLALLRQYLDGEIDDIEEIETSSKIDKPEITVYKAYGGKRFQIDCGTSGASVYYTTDGSTPTKSDTKYTGKFLVDKDTTVKAVAYKNGEYSEVKTRSVTVEQCQAPYADMDTGKEYSDSVKVTLDCATDGSRILYTTDGTDPIKYGSIYSSPVELTEDTTLKIAAECKGYSNSKVVTYNYKVKSSYYSISGYVWDDSSTATAPDGKYHKTETGINGITVYLLDTETNKYEQTTKTATIGGVMGSYVFNKAQPDKKYKVVFQFNGQEYRPYEKIVTDGNQAALTSEVPRIDIKNGGAYTSAGVLLVAVNSYSAAVVSAYYNDTYATTSSVYTGEAANANCALISDIYGKLEVQFAGTSVTSSDTGTNRALSENQKVFANDTITYTMRIKNNSDSRKLLAGELMVYVDSDLSIQSIKLSDKKTATYSYQGTNSTKDYAKYLVTCPEIAAGKYYDFLLEVKVSNNVTKGSEITCYAEIYSYAFEGSCYDKDSIPGNFTGTVRENDEAASMIAYGYDSLTDSQSISWAKGNDFKTPIIKGTSRVYTFYIANGVDSSDYNVYISDDSVVSYITSCEKTDTGTKCILVLTGKKAGTTNIVISLSRDSAKLIDGMVTVKELEE